MREFLKLYGNKITGAISGWDRIRFRGTIRWLASLRGMSSYMVNHGILLKNFGHWAERITGAIRTACAAQAESLGIPMMYLDRAGVDKEALARRIAGERGIDTGNICMFSVVEPCIAPRIKGNRATQHLELQMAQRKCVFIYHYWNDPIIGFGHTRLQTWLPLSATVCLNGRHWLERQILAESVEYVKDGNCFPFIADLPRAQQLLDEQLRTKWPELLDGLLDRNCPMVRSVFDDPPLEYYWSADESEWATDLMFRSGRELDSIYPSLLRHGMLISDSASVMRFFGKRNISLSGKAKGRVAQEIVSDLRRRHEGIRIKHWINRNSVKMYNKSGNVLRFETTINNTRDFKVYRCPADDTRKPASWQPLRKGVSDLHRRGEVSNQANERYAEAISAIHVKETLRQVVAPACKPRAKNRRRYRALNPWHPEDHKLLTFVAKGELAINGFRNKNLRAWLYPDADGQKPEEQTRLSSKATRRIRLLRAHGLIRKVTGTNRYVVTSKGHKFSTALIGASALPVEQIMEKAS